MSTYRLYFMKPAHGHIERFEEFEAADDGEAVSLAERQQGLFALELWCSHRKVVRFEPLDLASQLLAERRTLKAVKAQVEPAASAQTTRSVNRSA